CFFWLAACCLTGPTGQQALGQDVYVTEMGHAEFVSKAPLQTFKGVSDKLNGYIDLDSGLVDFYLDLNTLDTGVGLRDRHMRNNYLETKKFPYAEFTGNLAEIPELGENPLPVRAVGVFTLHGVAREIEVSGTLAKVKGALRLNASWAVLLGDYGIPIPKVVFYELADEQQVNISAVLEAKQNEP
ncbi:MAG: YceI family protein, partial [Bernardetiaceae bacterium]